jgi:hypothetical protein
MPNSSFTCEDIERISNKKITKIDLREWVKRGYFNTPMEPVFAGKPREFPLTAVYEALLLRALSTKGVPMRIGKEIIRQSIEYKKVFSVICLDGDNNHYFYKSIEEAFQYARQKHLVFSIIDFASIPQTIKDHKITG